MTVIISDLDELYKKILETAGVVLLVLCLIWVAVVLLNSKWHFLY